MFMDRQVKSKKAWHIPFQIKDILGNFDIGTLSSVSLYEYIDLFNEHRLHRFNTKQAETFYFAIQRIADVYEGDVSRIWKDRPSSAKVVYEFLQFKNSGIKISTMSANILARDLHIPFSDYYSIDISTDTHVMRVMRRTGLVDLDANRNCVIYKARELNPDYPGIIDYACWEIGTNWCKPGNPDCANCRIREVCKKMK